MRGHPWTDREVQLLRNYYPVVSKEIMQRLLPQFTWGAIRQRAFLENKTRRYRCWTKEEDKLLIRYYKKGSKWLLERYFPYRTRVAIWHRANILGIQIQYGSLNNPKLLSKSIRKKDPSQMEIASRAAEIRAERNAKAIYP